MATQFVVTEPRAVLTRPMIDEGKALVRRLIERETLGLTAAFWLYLEDRNRWWLHLAAPLVGKEGPLAAYKLIYEEFQALTTRTKHGMYALEFTDITAIDAEDRLVRALRRIYPGGVHVGMARADQIVIDGRYFEGVLIYLL